MMVSKVFHRPRRLADVSGLSWLTGPEPGIRRRPDTVRERQLGEQERDVGGEARHALDSELQRGRQVRRVQP